MSDSESDASHMSEGCPADNLMKMLSREWTLHIIWILKNRGPQSFGVLKRKLPGKVSSKVLSERLRDLEALKLLNRKEIMRSNVIYVEYNLTKNGLSTDRFLVEVELKSKDI